MYYLVMTPFFEVCFSCGQKNVIGRLTFDVVLFVSVSMCHSVIQTAVTMVELPCLSNGITAVGWAAVLLQWLSLSLVLFDVRLKAQIT